MSYLNGDSQTFVPVLVGSYLIEVSATDSYSTQTKKYELIVQNPVTLLSYTVNPSIVMANDGSNYFDF